MAGKVLFAQVLHSHQPVGNFDHIFDWACREAYGPYIEEYLTSGNMPLSLHFSGPLLEWLQVNSHPLLDSLRKCADGGRVEFIGGGLYEPILTMLPPADLRGQLLEGAQLVEELLGSRPKGAWVTERVWEQRLAADLVDCGYSYTCLDDSHFQHTGLNKKEIGPPRLAEHNGRLLTVFPASERMRYLIPFGTVEDVIAELRSFLPEEGQALVVYADDGEKFGLWPGTAEHVYQNGWLRRFHQALTAESDWLEPIRLSDAFQQLQPAGLVYFGDDSYREMTEWVLPAGTQSELQTASKQLQDDARFEKVAPFIRGGSWNGFRSKYSELRRLYARMMTVSRAIAEQPANSVTEARRELYRCQCNCAWWHGVFGGLYLPHLRAALWQHLLRAERLLRESTGEKLPRLIKADLDLDGQGDFRLSSESISAFCAPQRGGRIFEIDWLGGDFNVTDVLTRRPEAYHHEILNCSDQDGDQHDHETSSSIHELQRETTGQQRQLLVYDSQPLESFALQIIPGDWCLEDLWRGSVPAGGGFHDGPYQVTATSGRSSSLSMTRRNDIPDFGTLEIKRDFKIKKSKLLANHRFINCGQQDLAFTAMLEIFLAPGFQAPESGQPRGTEVLFYQDASQLLSSCEGESLCAQLQAMGAAGASWQIKTVSQSESSYEITKQGQTLAVWWYLKLAPGDSIEKQVAFSLSDS
jgi:4-alpha-glucanotransferase